MPYRIFSKGLTLKQPTPGTRDYYETMGTDTYDKISDHDHTGSGKGKQLGSGALSNGAVTTPKIADGAVTVDKLAPGIISGNPTGVILPFAGAFGDTPAGYLPCNGDAVSRATYSDLFALIGTAYGAGDGVNTFNVPDLRGRFPFGVASSGTGDALGETFGQIDHTHMIPAHFHGMGTGADLNITASGNHAHSIDHDHASATTSSNGSHFHRMIQDAVASPSNTTNDEPSIARAYSASGSTFEYDLKTSGGTPTLARTSSEGAHTHTLDLPNFTGTSGSATHTHPSGNIAGRVGLVTGGVDGNASMTSAAGNPPGLAINFIIKT